MRLYAKDSACPKCGETDASVQWCPGLYEEPKQLSSCKRIWKRYLDRHGRFPGDNTVRYELTKEHMDRECGFCGYYWCERPLDSGAALEQLAAAAE